MKENPEGLFEKFLKASTCKATLHTFHSLCKELNLEYPPLRNASYDHITFYTRLKKALGTYWKAQSLFAKLDKKYNDDVNFTSRKNSTEKRDRAAKDFNVLVVGAGPCGLRTAIFTTLLGAKTVIVEKRDSFSRNNVLHLWPFTIEDLKALGAKKFNGRFCSGAIDHVSIRQLQLILMKAALIFGVEIHVNTGFVDLVPPNIEGMKSWRAEIDPEFSPVNDFEFHMIVGADGRKNSLKGFEKKVFRGSLAIGITVNFINKHTTAEAQVSEISGINFIYRQEFFRELNMKHNIDLENIVYYKDDTHYFVMTARKQSLIQRGVLKQNLDDPKQLVHGNNIDQKALLEYALDAVNFSTENKLPDLEVAINNYGLPDIALFDFTCMKSSVNASMFHEFNGAKLLKALVGDALLEPFWPKGTGIAKGFLAAFDTSWMLKQWALGRSQSKATASSLELTLLAEREGLHRMLAQVESNTLVQNYALYTIDPKSRYQFIPSKIREGQVRSFYVTDGKDLEPILSTEVDVAIVPSRLTRNVSFIKSNKLQNWCEKVLREFGSDVVVTNMSSSWRDGHALCTIINYYRPDILDLEQIRPGNAEFNNQLAFDAAETHLGITPIMSGKEMAECETVDDLVMVTYLSQFYEILKNETPVKPVRRVSDIFPTPPEESLPKAQNKKKSPLGLFTRISQQFKRKSVQRGSSKEYDLDSHDPKRRKTFAKQSSEVALTESRGIVLTKAVLPTIPDEDKENTVVMRNKPTNSATPGVRKSATNRISALGLQLISQLEQNSDVPVQKSTKQPVVKNSSDVCYFCGKTVYIVERLSVEGLFFHRQCFKCTHCETFLRPLNYKRDLDSGKFYCNVHYFANAEYLKPGGKDVPATSDTAPRVTPEIHIEKVSSGEEEGEEKESDDLAPSGDEHNLSVPTIEHGQVIMRRDLTPKRSDMEQMALSMSTAPIEIGEELLYKHNIMRNSHNSETESDSTSESEAEEFGEIANDLTGLRNHSAHEILSEHYLKKDSSATGASDSAFLSSESEGDEDISSLSSTSADDTQVSAKIIAEEGPEKDGDLTPATNLRSAHSTSVQDNISLSTASSDDENVDEDIVVDNDLKYIVNEENAIDAANEIDTDSNCSDHLMPDEMDENHEDDNLPSVVLTRKAMPESAERHAIENLVREDPCLSSASSNADGEVEEMELVKVGRKDTLEAAEEHMLNHPIRKTRSLSSSSCEESDEAGKDVAMSTASSEEDTNINSEIEARLTGTDFREPPPSNVKDDTTVWVTNSVTAVESACSVSPVSGDVPGAAENKIQRVSEDPAKIKKFEEVYASLCYDNEPMTDPSVTTPKISSSHSENEVFMTPCGDKTELDSFYTVKSDQSTQDISSYISPGEMDVTLTSEGEDSNISDNLSMSKPKVRNRRLPRTPDSVDLNASGSPISSTPQVRRVLPQVPKSDGRRRLPVIPYLEALSPTTGEVSPKQRQRIEMKLKNYENRVTERIRKMKLGKNAEDGGKKSSFTEKASDCEETQAAERNDFVSHVPILIEKRNNALMQKKHKHNRSGGDDKKGFSFFGNKKKTPKGKEPVVIPKAKVMSPSRSSRKRNLSPLTKEEMDNRVSQRVRLAAQRQAKEAEKKRMDRALVIQGQLQEVDSKRKQLEERGVELEKLLRGKKSEGASVRDSSLHMNEWFKLVQEKNALLRYENELMIYQRQLQLEDRQSRLQQVLRERMAVDDSKKSPEELAVEKKILSEMIDIVEQRDQLVALLDEHRVQDQEENADIQQLLMDRFLTNSSADTSAQLSSI